MSSVNLWQLLCETDESGVIIPIIQRDYALGRAGYENRRRKFLRDDIKKHLDMDADMKLDFVFGVYKNDGRFLPLDGQQRLTTLWLIYWYFAFMAWVTAKSAIDCTYSYNNADYSFKKILKEKLIKFQYETRTSSTEFCESLCSRIDIKKYQKFIKSNPEGTLAEFIKNQTWFFADWANDPTIESMLRMLSEDTRTNNAFSCIEHVFKGVNYREYFSRINQHVKFNCIEVGINENSQKEKMTINSDNQYIRMNSRGKALTIFEKFKNNLIAWMISEKENGKSIDPISIAANIDNTWTFEVWKKKKDRCKIDNFEFDHDIDSELYAFINRYIIADACLLSDRQPNDYKGDLSKSDDERLSAFYSLYKNQDLDKALFRDTYQPIINVETIIDLDEIFKKVHSGNYSFVYEYSEKNKLRPKQTKESKEIKEEASQKVIVYSFAICRLVRAFTGDLDKDKKMFSDSMRVVRNLVENSDIKSVPTMVSCIRRIDFLFKKLVKNNWNMYDVLSEELEDMAVVTAEEKRKEDNIRNLEKEKASANSRRECPTYKDKIDYWKRFFDIIIEFKKWESLHHSEDSYLSRQWKEECEKAFAIKQGWVTEKEIQEAEAIGFFDGSIRFLYRNEYDKATRDSWNDFLKKKNRCNLLFNNNSTVAASVTKEFLNMFKDFNDLVRELPGTGRKKESKKFYFTEKCDDKNFSWKKDVLWGTWSGHKILNDFLLDNPVPVANRSDEYNAFLNSTLIDEICKENYYIYIDSATNVIGLSGSGSGKTDNYIAIRRGATFSDTKKMNQSFIGRIIPKSDVDKIRNLHDKQLFNGFLWGKKIIFPLCFSNSTNTKYYGWDINGKVCLQKRSAQKFSDDTSEQFNNLNDFIDAMNKQGLSI